MKNKKNMLLSLILSTLMLSSFLSIAHSEAENTLINKEKVNDPIPQMIDEYYYKGNLKVYIVEPESRWIMNDGNPYHNGFIDYAIEEEISLDYLEDITIDTIWNSQEAGISDVEKDNIIVIAAIFNKNNFEEYAYPPFKNPFYAHYVDAAAGAKPGEMGTNFVNDSFTHTVFAEEGTATWCPYCPAMANALNTVYSSNKYPFYFVAHVTDKNPLSEQRLQAFNLYGYPSSFFDGGKKVIVGGNDQVSFYQSRIEKCGNTDVHNLSLSLQVDWNENDEVEISVNIVNTEKIEQNSPPATPTINGNISGKKDESIKYSIKAQDPDSNSVYYYIDWGSSNNNSWIGPIPSDEYFIQNHIWDESGSYTIRVKAKDIYDQESDWATLDVSITKQKSLLSLLENQFPLLFKIIYSFEMIFIYLHSDSYDS